MALISRLTKDLINKIICEFKNKDNRNIINHEVIHPIMYYIGEYIMKKIYPFLIIGILIFILTFIFCIINFLLIVRLNYKK
jgi:uncharacterized integral membrane protein